MAKGRKLKRRPACHGGIDQYEDEKMNRIQSLFERKHSGILSVYFSAGFPSINDTAAITQWLQEAGADMVEIGIPFSDPVADGPTIQASNKTALDNGMTMKLLFQQLEHIREKVDLPIILMGYINPVVQYGVEAFCDQCARVGVDGLIFPDLPMAEYQEEYKAIFEKNGLLNVFLITPHTREARIREIDRHTNGFIYMVSSASVTGAKKGISDEQIEYFCRIQSYQLKNPTLIGFGISDRESFDKACQYASGAIIGSAFIDVLRNADHLEQDVKAFVANLRG